MASSGIPIRQNDLCCVLPALSFQPSTYFHVYTRMHRDTMHASPGTQALVHLMKMHAAFHLICSIVTQLEMFSVQPTFLAVHSVLQLGQDATCICRRDSVCLRKGDCEGRNKGTCFAVINPDRTEDHEIQDMLVWHAIRTIWFMPALITFGPGLSCTCHPRVIPTLSSECWHVMTVAMTVFRAILLSCRLCT